MEYAQRIYQSEELNRLGASITRIYYGDEFCERLLPSDSDFKDIRVLSKSRGLSFSFVTPPVSEKYLDIISRLLEYLEPGDEVVVNDFGVLKMINSIGLFNIVIGRVLSRLLVQGMNQYSYEGSTEDYLKCLGNITMIETDMHRASEVTDRLASKISFSLYYDTPFLGITRRCAFNRNSKRMNLFAECGRECKNEHAILSNAKINKQILLKGNRMLQMGTLDYPLPIKRLFTRVVFGPRSGDIKFRRLDHGTD